ncbi:MAG: glycosyltransferase family 39 protein, partial [Achromobacter sp.]|uniref:glycosyltransferase family 39 protein n=1 Tax=Achromobacter sp. TaxID=134375 RepID=UPI002587373A
QSFWNDEGSSYVQATRSFAEIAANAALDIHPPGYYWLLGGWRLLAGTSEFALRALSVFASLLSIAFAAALGRRLFGWGAALSAALLIALNTFSIYYAQEARMYALLA